MFARMCLLAVMTSVSVAAARVDAGDEPSVSYTPAEMLAELRARDPELDNYSLSFKRLEIRRIDERVEFQKQQFNRIRFGGEAEQAPASFPDPYDAVLMMDITMAVRDRGLVFRHVWLTDHHGHPQIPRHGIWVDEADVYRELHESLSETTLTIRPLSPAQRAGNQEQRMYYELALGVGYGRRIREIESLEQSDTGWQLTGTIQLWSEDETTFQIETDEDLFVRKAHLHANVHGNETTFDFTSSGAIRTDGQRPIAEKGTVKRVHVAYTPAGGERRDDGSIQYQYEVEVAEIEFDLTDERYAELSAIDPAQADYVMDERPKN
jgi:hypothetical protein